MTHTYRAPLPSCHGYMLWGGFFVLMISVLQVNAFLNVTAPVVYYQRYPGESVVFQCIINSDAVITGVTWFFSNQVYDVTQSRTSGGVIGNPSLELRNLVSSDAGSYICNARNSVNENASSTHITLGISPTSVPSNVQISSNFGGSSITLNPGQSVQLSCTASGTPGPAFSWTRNGAQVSTGSNYTISSATASSAGQYTCTASNVVGSASATIDVAVFAAPSSVQINSGASTITLNAGDSVQLSCAASGSPGPTFTWTRNGAQIWTGSPYTISSATANSAGQYNCTASNTQGSASASVNVVVYVPPSSVSLSVTSQSVNAGASVVFTCVSQNASPTQSFQFLKDGFAVTSATAQSSATSETYSLSSVTASDAGTYQCRASNNAGTVSSPTLTFTVITDVAPTSASITSVPASGTINEGGAITLTCSSDGSPISYSWSRNTDSTTLTGASITITNAGTADSALYICRASNSQGNVLASYAVTVIFSPKAVAISPTSLTVSVGDPIQLTCNSDGSSPTITWTHGSSSYTGSPLNIASAQVSDSGAYTCTSTNSAGSLTSSGVTVTVQFAPTTVTISPSTLTVNSGDTIQLTCSADGYPTPTYRWIKGTNTWDVQTLSIASSTGADSGTYVCQATNTQGSLNDSVFVTVQTSPPSNIAISPSSLSIYSSQSIELTCSSDGSEPLVFNWFRDTDDNTWNGNPLIISPAEASDTAVYTCRVSNYAGSLNTSATVEVIIPEHVQNLKIESSSPVVNRGESVQLTCNATSTTAVTYSWSRGDDSLSTEQVLTISSASSADEGLYICQATNLAGNSLTSYYLTVVVPPENVTISADSLSVVLGDPLSLKCDGDGAEPQSYIWTKDGHEWNGQFFNVSSTTASDTGVYTCQVTNTAGSMTSSVNVLIKYSPRNVIITPGTQTVNVNAFVTLVCQADGSMRPTYQWIKDGVVIGQGSRLSIPLVSASDDGDYVCMASNDVGSANQTATLDVIVYDAPQTISVTPPTLSIRSGESIQLTCQADGSPSQNYTWTKADNSWTDSVLIINAASSSDSGEYTCLASNPGGSLNETATVLVFDAPTSMTISPPTATVNSGAQLLLTCDASGSPSQTYTWTKGDNSWSGPVLNITSATSTDSGSYTCEASNLAGSLSETAEVTVYSAPSSVTISPSSLSINLGDPVTLSCSADGQPSQSFTWYHGDDTSEGTSLNIASATLSDAGIYTCQSSNQAGSLNFTAEVKVFSSPENVIIWPSYLVVNTSDPIQLTCTGDGIPTQSYQWAKGDNSWDGDTLNITSASTSDAGIYTCTATNQAGHSSVTVTVVVTVEGYLPPSSVTIATSVNANQVVEGSSFQLQCTGDGTPSQNYSWSKESNEWTGRTLSISSASSSDSGVYICMASNPAGSAFGSFSLTVIIRPKNVTVFPTITTVASGQPFTLRCSGDGQPANTQTYAWTMGSRSWTGQVLSIDSASSQDNGIFTCQVSNTAGSLSSIGSVYVNTSPSNFQFSQTSPLTVRLGNAFSVTCSASGNPAPTFTWTKGGTVRSNTATLSVSSATKSDNGVYICAGTNTAGTLTAQFEIEVQYAPEITVSSSASSISATSGSSVTMNCANSANPAVLVYEWNCGGTAVNQSQISYSIVASGSNFQCTCKAFNTIGVSAVQTFSVTVSSTGTTPGVGAATGDTGLSAGEIAAICLAVLFVFLILIIILVCCCLYGVCAGICGKKEKAKVEPTKVEKKEIVHHVDIPRFHEKPYLEYKPKPRQPSAVTRQDVALTVQPENMFEEEEFEINTKYELVPPGSHRSVNGTIISMQDQPYVTPRSHRLPALDLTYDEEERRRKKRRHRKKKKHHRREPAEGMESPHEPRESSRSRSRSHGRRSRRSHREPRENLVDSDTEVYHSRYDEGDLVVIPGPDNY